MTINELRTKRAKAWESAKAFLDSHRNDKGVLSAEDDATYSRMESEITDLGRENALIVSVGVKECLGCIPRSCTLGAKFSNSHSVFLLFSVSKD